MEETDFKKRLRGRVIDKIRDLKEKIETNESLPGSEGQDTDFLLEVEDQLDGILNAWYY